MAIEASEILQFISVGANLILLPIWKELKELRRGQEQTNITLAKEYMAKADCNQKHADINSDIKRIHDRIDEKNWGK